MYSRIWESRIKKKIPEDFTAPKMIFNEGHVARCSFQKKACQDLWQAKLCPGWVFNYAPLVFDSSADSLQEHNMLLESRNLTLDWDFSKSIS